MTGIIKTYLSSLQPIVPCGDRKTSPRKSSWCRLYFLVLWDHPVHFCHLIKPVLGDVAGVAHSFTGHEQTQ